MKMLFALIIMIIIVTNFGNIYANNINTAEDPLTKDTIYSTVNSFNFHDNSIDNINQVKNSIKRSEFMNNLHDDISKPIIENDSGNSANITRDNNCLNEKTLNSIIGNKSNLNNVVNNTTTENTTVDILSTEIVVNLTATQNLIYNNNNNNNLTSGILAAGDDSSLFSQSSILNAASNVKKYVEKNGKLPNYVTIGNEQVSMKDFLYLLAKTIVNVNKKIKSNVFWKDVKVPSKPIGTTITGNVNKNNYLALSQNVVNFIEKNSQAPNYGSTSLGKVQYQTIIYAFARILDFTSKNSILPNYVTLNTENPANLNKIIPKYEISSQSFSVSLNLSLANIKDAGSRVEAFYNINKVLPTYVTISGKQYSMSQFLYLASTAIVNMQKGINKEIASMSVKDPKNPNGNSKAGEINKANYIDLTSRVSVFIAKNGQAPNFGESPLGKIDFNLLVFGFSKILKFSQINNVLPNHVTLNKSGTMGINSQSTLTSSMNDKYIGESLRTYLATSTNCQVNDATIKALTLKLTKGVTSEWAKAESIFNYVRDKISYSFYFNTKYGAKNTLNGKTGNCVDQTHLLIALLRANGLAARYVNGEATFTSGSTYGHVWAQIKIGDTWVVADTTSSKNTLGVIKNWNTNTAKIYGTYASINF